MRILINSYNIQKTEIKRPIKNNISIPIIKEELKSSQINFTSSSIVNKTITTQINHEKSKLLKQINDILALEIPTLSENEKLFSVLRQFNSFIKMKKRKREEIERDLEALRNAPFINQQQRYERAIQLETEYDKLKKLKLEKPIEKQPSKDNYDFILINKFKTAILNDNFDLAQVEKKHYENLKSIKTLEEFKQKYPTIRIPNTPESNIINKILDTLNRKFYIDLFKIYEQRNEDLTADAMMDFFNDYFEKLSLKNNFKTKDDLIDLFCVDVAREIINIFEKKKVADEFNEIPELKRLKLADDFDSIPIKRNSDIANITENDKFFLDINYDLYVLNILKQIYLDKKKLNQIEYNNGEIRINISSIKEKGYQFEKIPEKTKKIIQDSQKAQQLQRDYKNFSKNELQNRLNYYSTTEISDDDFLFNLIVDFNYCKYTEEDRQYLIKLLNILDDISDGKLNLEEGINFIKHNNIHPHGTIKLNNLERKQAEERFKQDKQKALVLNEIRKDFNILISNLYEMNLPAIAEKFLKYYPESLEDETIKNINQITNIVNKYLSLKDANKIQNGILRWETFNDYAKNDHNSEEFISALDYAKNFNIEEKEERAGLYLLNREIIDNYPATVNLVKNPKILAKIMEKFSNNKNIATIYLCKYEDYNSLCKEEKESILNITKIFDPKTVDDKIILKNIIEEDYVNIDTQIISVINDQEFIASLSSKAKKSILEKYLFPNCIDFFIAFEDALSTRATEYGTAGIKKTGSNNNALDYKMEVKIKGYPDRLFSSNNNYYFDIYSEKGLH